MTSIAAKDGQSYALANFIGGEVMAVIGSYELVGRVTNTRTGAVWQARDPRLDRLVALKQVNETSAVSANSLAEEARILGELDHPNIVAVYDLIVSAGASWMVEEWVDGATLDRVAAASGGLRAEQAIGVVRGALEGLSYVHGRGLVHGDVAPGNVLIDLAGTAKLIDFGLAGPDGSLATAGTVGYSSPEVSAGAPISARSDVYSAAAVLALLLAGTPLYTGQTATDVSASQLVADPAVALRGVRPQVAAVLVKALARNPDDRFAGAAEFLAALDQAARDDYGPEWLSRAGVSGAVAGAGTAVVAVAASSGASGASGAPEAVLPIAAAGARRIPGRVGMLVAAGTGVAVVAVIVAVVARHKDHPAAAKDVSVIVHTDPKIVAASPTPTPTPTPTSGATTFSGRYKVTVTYVSATGDDLKYVANYKKQKSAFTWTVTNDCTPGAGPCTVHIASSSGTKIVLKSADGLSWTRRNAYPHNHCYYVDQPTKIAPNSYYDYVLTENLHGVGGADVRLTGTLHEADSKCSGPEGNGSKPGTVTWKVTAVKVS